MSATIVPFPSELLVLNYLGEKAFFPVIAFATMGNWLGGLTSFYLGWLAKWSWIEKYLRVKQEKVESWKEKVEKYGSWLALLCWLPFVGDIIAVGLGVFRVRVLPVAVLMLIGKLARYLVLGLA